MNSKIRYDFTAKLWRYKGKGGWYFVALPHDDSKEIRESLKWQEEGWGRMKATAIIAKVEWDTAIWFDKKLDTYLLPIKTDIRTKCSLKLEDVINVSLWI